MKKIKTKKTQMNTYEVALDDVKIAITFLLNHYSGDTIVNETLNATLLDLKRWFVDNIYNNNTDIITLCLETLITMNKLYKNKNHLTNQV